MYKAAYIFCGKEKRITKQISDKSLVNNFTVISYLDLKGKAINFQPPLTPYQRHNMYPFFCISRNARPDREFFERSEADLHKHYLLHREYTPHRIVVSKTDIVSVRQIWIVHHIISI